MTSDQVASTHSDNVSNKVPEILPEQLIIHIIDDEESVRTSCDFLISSL